jgi:hypothetical protein
VLTEVLLYGGLAISVGALIGLCGKLAFSSDGQWFLPYYVDIGSGDSDLTWQAATGLGYGFRWGEIAGIYR